MLCKLCQKKPAVDDSHVIPAFVGKRLKRSSATGHMRRAVNPNVRVQDFLKFRLLCKECEELFSGWETRFSKKVFLPYQDKGQAVFQYDKWLLLFAVSLSWRIGTADRASLMNFKPNLVPYLDTALETWREFLLGRTSQPQPYEHHLLFLDFVVKAQGIQVPDGFHWYILRSVDATLPASDTELAVYTKLPGMVFFSSVYPEKLVGWENTRILESGVIQSSGQAVRNCRFGNFLLHRAQEVIEPFNDLSDRQDRKIAKSMERDIARTLGSQSSQVHLIELLEREKGDSG
jgi:hypothetical protein